MYNYYTNYYTNYYNNTCLNKTAVSLLQPFKSICI